MLKKENQGIVWYEFEILQNFPEICHASFTKVDGRENNLNLAYTFSEKQEIADKNRKRAFQAKQIPENVYYYFAKQVHGDNVFNAIENKNSYVEGYDAFITKNKNLALCIQHADCQAAFLYDPHLHVIGAIHAGWRGNVCNIYAKTIQEMQNCFGSKPEDLIACIGPSLGPDNAEFVHYKQEFPESFWSYQVKPNHFSLWDIAEKQLKDAGIKQSHIEIARICTYDDPETFYSYRRDKKQERHVSFIYIQTSL